LATISVDKAIIKAEALSVLKANFAVSNTAHKQAGSTLILYFAGTKQIVARTLLSYQSLTSGQMHVQKVM
jgi:transcription elongation factor GreA-like protein